MAMELSRGGGYEIRLTEGTGRELAQLEKFEQLSYVKSLDMVGTFALTIPDGIYPDSYWQPDRLIQFWRRGHGQRRHEIDFLGFLRRWRYQSDPDGHRRLVLTGVDQNCLVDRRIVAYASGTSQAQISSKAIDDAMKKLARENLGALATDADRDLSDAGLIVHYDVGAGATVTKEHAWRNVGQIVRDLAALSREQTPEILYWIRVAGIQPDGSIVLQFETGTDYLRRDFGQDSARPLRFGDAVGNVSTAALEYDYTEEVNHAYAGGMGEGSERKIAEASDMTAQRVSPWSRIEAFVDARNAADAHVDDLADQRLAAGRPVRRFEADIIDTPAAPYGYWNLGDRVVVAHRGVEFDALIRNVRVTGANGQENIATRITEIIT